MKRKKNAKVSESYLRANDMVLYDRFGFDREIFCNQLSVFLSEMFLFDSLTVDAVDGKSNNLVVRVNIKNVKKSRAL